MGSCPQGAVLPRVFSFAGSLWVAASFKACAPALAWGPAQVSQVNFCLFHHNLSWASGEKKNNLHDCSAIQKLQSHGSHGAPPPTPSLTLVTSGSLHSQFYCSLLNLLQCYFFVKMLSEGPHQCWWWVQLWPVADLVWSCLNCLSRTGGSPWSLPTEVTPALLLLVKPWHENPIVRKKCRFSKTYF